MFIRRKSEALRNERQGHTRHQSSLMYKHSPLFICLPNSDAVRRHFFLYIYIIYGDLQCKLYMK